MPYRDLDSPAASSPAVRALMQGNRSKATRPEMAVRRACHRLGLRYWANRRPLPTLRREADLVFPRARVAVFVDGCFWHGCPQHATQPRSNSKFWRDKVEANRARDRDTDRRLEEAGWCVVRVWEHEDPETAAERIAALVVTRRAEV